MNRAVIAALAVILTGCGSLTWGEYGLERVGSSGADAAERSERSERTERAERAERLEAVRPPADVPPGEKGDSAAWAKALERDGQRIVISRESRTLWLLDDDSVLFSAPVAVGREEIFEYAGQTWDFSTPTGQMRVLDKETDPLWVPPDWHYYEIAVERDVEPVKLRRNQTVALSDGTSIEVRDGVVGRVNRFGNWWPFTPGSEIVFDGKVFIPPIPSPQREVPKVLGTHRLILGDGYLIHGTPEVDSIGEWASHGCVRLRNADIERLYGMVERGTEVFVY